MRLRHVAPTVALVVSLSFMAVADRASDLLDGLEVALTDSLAASQEDTSRAGLKKTRLLQSLLVKLQVDTASELEDLKLLKKVAGAVEKKLSGEAAVVAALDDAIAATDADVEILVSGARAALGGAEEGKAKTRVTKLTDKAEAALERARAKTTRRAAVAGLYKARKLAEAADSQAFGLLPPEAVASSRAIVIAPNESNIRTVFRVDFPGATKTPLTSGTTHCFVTNPSPTASPDSAHFACREGTQLALGDYEGVVYPETTADWFFFEFSPDSTHLAACGTNPDVLVVYDMDGVPVFSSGEVVLRNPGSTDPVAWSPDGSLLAFRTDRDEDGSQELQVLDLAEGSTVNAAPSELANLYFESFGFVDDGTLLYHRDLAGTLSTDVLEIGDLAGLTPLTLTSVDQDVRAVDFEVHDGQILFVYAKDGDDHLATVGTDGSPGTELFTANVFQDFEWSKDGSRIAFIADGGLHTITPAGTGDVLITETCPDFTWTDLPALLFRDGPGGSSGNDLFVSDADGGRATRISPDLDAGEDTEPTYSWNVVGPPDNRKLDVTMVSDDESPNVRSVYQTLVDFSGPAIESDRKLIQTQIQYAEVEEIDVLTEVIPATNGDWTDTVVKYYLVHDSLSGKIYFCSITFTFHNAFAFSFSQVECAEFSGYFYDYLMAERVGLAGAGAR